VPPPSDARSALFLATKKESAQIEDDHATFDVIFRWLGFRRRVVHVNRELEAGAIEFLPTLHILFPPPDLIDNERRKHLESSLSVRACAGNTIEL